KKAPAASTSRVVVSTSSDTDPPTDNRSLAQQHGVPFDVQSMDEVMAYKRLAGKPLAAPRTLDWDYFETLGIKDDLSRYITLLDLVEFEDMEQYTYRNLTLEFFSTVSMHDNGKYLTARLKGQQYKVTDEVLRDIFKFKASIGTRHSPMGWKADPYWPTISKCEKFKRAGASSGLLSDVAHAVIHKYISHMIFAKKESNKVSEQQVFIIWSISRDKSVSMLQYLKESLFDVRNDPRRGPTLGHIVSKFAEHFGIDVDEPKIHSRTISHRELYQGHFLKPGGAVLPVRERESYKAYSWVKDRRVIVLVDNGSSHNFINTDLSQKMKLPTTKIEPFEVRVANGERLQCTESFRKVPIKFNGVTVKADLYALPLVGPDVFLGVQWLEGLGKVTTDYRTGIMEFNSGGRQVTL
ncbi:Unknown protein, partial [Striga hermonthica]